MGNLLGESEEKKGTQEPPAIACMNTIPEKRKKNLNDEEEEKKEIYESKTKKHTQQ